MRRRKQQAAASSKIDFERLAAARAAASERIGTASFSDALPILFCLGIVVAAIVQCHRLAEYVPPPAPKTAFDRDFSEDRAMVHLRALNHERLPFTSAYNRSLEYVLNQLKSINAVGGVELEVSLTYGSGSFFMRKFVKSDLVNHYDSIPILAARLRAPQSSGAALLVNTHIDSAPTSPGAADAAAPAAVMLECVRALAEAPGAAWLHDVVFLWNGAEEMWLQGAHAFISGHPWARDVRAFLNLEALGRARAALLFQAGPREPWLLDAYAAVPRPVASSLGQDVFASGVIPADDDFRIFRDFGGLSGLDWATSYDGYTYHTAGDDADGAVDAGSLQHTGDNALAFVRAALRRPELAAARRDAAAPPAPAVYFDLFGLAVVRYPADGRAARAAPAVILALLAVVLLASGTKALPAGRILRGALAAIVWHLLAALAGLLCSAALAAALLAAGRPLAWYGSLPLPFLMYGCPAAAGALWVHGTTRSGSQWALELAGAFGSALALTALAAASAAAGLGASFVPAAHAAAAVLGAAVLATPLPRRGRAACGAALVALLPMPLSGSATAGIARTFLPMIGRAGPDPLNEVALAAVIAALVLWHLVPLLPFLAALAPAGPFLPSAPLRRTAAVLALLAAATALVAAAGRTPYGASHPKRLIAVELVAPAGRELLVVPMDHGPAGLVLPRLSAALEAAFPGAARAAWRPVPDTRAALAAVYPAAGLYGRGHALPLEPAAAPWAPPPPAVEPPSVRAVRSARGGEAGGRAVRNVTVEARCPGAYGSLEFDLGPDRALIAWSLDAPPAPAAGAAHAGEFLVRHIGSPRWELALAIAERGPPRPVPFVLSCALFGAEGSPLLAALDGGRLPPWASVLFGRAFQAAAPL